MRVKVKKTNKDGLVRLETSGKIMEVLLNEDIMRPSKESVSVCFRGENSSGIVEFTPEEIEKLYMTVKRNTGLIKGAKVLRG